MYLFSTANHPPPPPTNCLVNRQAFLSHSQSYKNCLFGFSTNVLAAIFNKCLQKMSRCKFRGPGFKLNYMGLVRPVMSNSLMKGIKSLDWHIKRGKKNLTAMRLYPKSIKWRSMCAQWPWDWLDLHLRVDRNGLQMNEIRSMCSGDSVTFKRRNENKSFTFHLKPGNLKDKP